MRFETKHDAQLYLCGSLVRYRDKVIYVRTVHDDMTATVVNVLDDSKSNVPINDLDLTPIKIGYIFDERHNMPLYIERIPKRAWRQGLTAENLKVRNNRGIRVDVAGGRLIKKAVKPDYPKIREAMSLSKDLGSDIPFHRQFSVDYKGRIRYKTVMVGKWNGKTFDLDKQYTFLKELLGEITHADI